MTDQQVQHIINMLAGIQDCLKWLAFVVILHILLGGSSTSGIERAIERLAETLRKMR
jgi:choline-glycine betaine transporter